MSYKEFTPFGVLRRSPVWRNGTYACNLLQVVFSNLVFEIRSAPLSVRCLDYWKEFLNDYYAQPVCRLGENRAKYMIKLENGYSA